MLKISNYLKQARMQEGKFYIQEFQTMDPIYFYMKDTKKNGNPSGLLIGGAYGNKNKVKQTTVQNQSLWKEVKESGIPSKYLTKLKSKM